MADNAVRPGDDTRFFCGQALIRVVETEAEMGRRTADGVIEELKKHAAAGPLVLWLMAAPSAFSFYRALLDAARQNAGLRGVLRETHFFQFDDYPIARGSARFAATFRHLLEKNLYEPLAALCGSLPHLHPLELCGDGKDAAVQRAYSEELQALRRRGAWVVQLKGTGMDGHWGFHGAETPLDTPSGMITVPMSGQNIRQQMLDWPRLFPTPEDVPQQAVTFNVGMFLQADRIFDNTPQPQKEYALLAAYGTEAVIGEIPSSAVKRHPRAEAWVTRAAARALLEYRAGRRRDPGFSLPAATQRRLEALWRNPALPEMEARNIAQMNAVLGKLGILPR